MTSEQLAVPSRQAWLEHPVIAAHYTARSLITGLRWEHWVSRHLGAPPARSLELACGDGARSLYLFEEKLAGTVDGLETSEDLVLAAEASRARCRAPGLFRQANLNTHRLPRSAYDLIFGCYALHRVVALEHLFDEVYGALSPAGLFVVEGYVGPSRFQWTEAQMSLVETLLSCLPERFRRYPWGVVKTREGRPDRAAVAAHAPFDAIRSGEILSLFRQRFDVIAVRNLGGTLQNLLHNGIVHNFGDEDPEAARALDAVIRTEDALVDAGLLPSDFVVMIGSRRSAGALAGPRPRTPS